MKALTVKSFTANFEKRVGRRIKTLWSGWPPHTGKNYGEARSDTNVQKQTQRHNEQQYDE
jgi:hypothetical protein